MHRNGVLATADKQVDRSSLSPATFALNDVNWMSSSRIGAANRRSEVGTTCHMLCSFRPTLVAPSDCFGEEVRRTCSTSSRSSGRSGESPPLLLMPVC